VEELRIVTWNHRHGKNYSEYFKAGEPEEAGKLSKWITLQALLVLKRLGMLKLGVAQIVNV